MHGCVVDGPQAYNSAVREWSEALTASELPEPRVEAGEHRYVITEYVNGFAVQAGTIRFEAGLPTYTDGSAKFVGFRFANSSGAVVQLKPGGGFVAAAVAVLRDGLQSAIAGETTGVELLALILARGTPDGQPHEAGSVVNHVDCSAVIATFARHRRGEEIRRFPFAGAYRMPGLAHVDCFVKVDARVWEEDARRQGWRQHRLGNEGRFLCEGGQASPRP